MTHAEQKRKTGKRTLLSWKETWNIVARHPFAGYILLFVLSLSLSVFRSRLIPVIPVIHDEYAYLLQSDTFAQGRLTNPTTPFWRHFDTFHTIFEPTYNAKYPPGQGFTLAAGQILFGSPLVGVWLTVALGCLAVYAALRAALPPRWSLLGGLAVTLHPLIVAWSQGYWGGGLAMTGGALVLTAVLRLARARGKWRPWHRGDLKYGFLLGLGLGILANSRPFEGVVFALLTIGWLVVRSLPYLRQGRLPVAAVLRVAGIAILPLAIILGMTLRYNQAVTGSALRLPYALYANRQEATAIFLWQKPKPIPTYETPEIEKFWLDYRRKWEEQRESKAAFLRASVTRLLDALAFFRKSPFFSLGFLCLLVFVAGSFRYSQRSHGGGSVVSERTGRFLVGGLMLFLLPLMTCLYLFPHYTAPALGLMALSGMMGLRYLAMLRGIRQARPVQLLLVVILPLLVLFPLLRETKKTYDSSKSPNFWAKQRNDIQQEMTAKQQRVLLFVRYADGHRPDDEWVFNGADLENAPVLWARDRNHAENQRLLNHYSNRAAYLVTVRDTNSPATIVPYSGTE